MKNVTIIVTIAIAIVAVTPTSACDNDIININEADEQQLQKLKGIGPVLSKHIVEYREANGPFKSIDDLEGVKGIGQKTVEKNRDRMTV